MLPVKADLNRARFPSISRWSASVTAPELHESAPFRGRTRPPFTLDSERRCRL